MLLNCNGHVLVLIEDSLELERELLITLFDCLNKKFKLTHYQKFHIYITSCFEELKMLNHRSNEQNLIGR